MSGIWWYFVLWFDLYDFEKLDLDLDELDDFDELDLHLNDFDELDLNLDLNDLDDFGLSIDFVDDGFMTNLFWNLQGTVYSLYLK